MINIHLKHLQMIISLIIKQLRLSSVETKSERQGWYGLNMHKGG